MTALPSVGHISNNARTEGEVKTDLEAMRDVEAEMPGGSVAQTLTISSGNITPATQSSPIIVVDTEAAAATDDLTNILQTNTRDGHVLFIRSANDSRDPTVKHNAGGAGTILLADSADYVLATTKQWLILYRSGTTWIEIGRHYGDNLSLFRTYLGLGTAALVNTGTAGGNVPTNTQAATLYAALAGATGQTFNVGTATANEHALRKEQFDAVVNELLGAQAESTLTIASGDVTPTRAIHSLDTEAAAAADDLDHFLQTNLDDGRLLLVRAVNASHVVTLKHNTGGAGNIQSVNGADIVLDATTKWVLFQRRSTSWYEVIRGNFSGTRYTSSDITISDGGSGNLTHGLGTTPVKVWFALVCQNSSCGFSPGDIVFQDLITYQGTSFPEQGVVFNVSSTQVSYKFGQPTLALPVFMLIHKTTGILTFAPNADWKMRVYAEI